MDELYGCAPMTPLLLMLSCENIGRFVVVGVDGTERVEVFSVPGLRKGSHLEAVTLAFMFMSGLWAVAIWAGLGKHVNLFIRPC